MIELQQRLVNAVEYASEVQEVEANFMVRLDGIFVVVNTKGCYPERIFTATELVTWEAIQTRDRNPLRATVDRLYVKLSKEKHDWINR